MNDVRDSSPDITELIVKWKSGSSTSFNDIFSYCYQRIKNEVRKQKLKQNSKSAALDICLQTTTTIVHDAYIKLSKHREQTVSTRKELYTLIAQVVKSVLYDQYRKASSLKRKTDSADNFNHEQNHIFEVPDIYAKLNLAETSLAAEKERCVEVFNLSLFAGLTPDEIANLLGISIRTVHNDLSFAKSWYLNELVD
ncbi:ECF-type sigma factor [Catenovulum maritimum]|uniref:RNA polymerase sigma-70 ECF-like HTH domain-containing protein n=1 Tax=Catenovulum maritimum TaxID=1513271 RepID=A0A0J8GSJ7_9ALTE|nr:ECF-type sigma factor [Catenovulum maritimum]KMT64269.1 hypothetical protein XM47_15460 [Catenovulum maritimum]